MITLLAAGMVDVDAGSIVRPGVIRIEGDRITGFDGPALPPGDPGAGEIRDLGDLILLPGLTAAGPDEFGSLLAKAAAGRAALTAARHCQQVLGGIGFTAEHALHVHIKRVLVLDGLLGSARELTREAGRLVIASGSAPRLADL